MIKIQDLTHKYDFWESNEKRIKKTVLDGISLDIPSGQFWAIIGPNGCGKSTLAKHMNALLLPESGVVLVDGNDITDGELQWKIRDTVGMVFQNPDNQIIGTSVEEDVAFGPEMRCVPSEEIRARVTENLQTVGLLEKRKTSPNRLSGGQKQRVAIAGVRATRTPCIVFDEPTAMLDTRSRKEVVELIHRLNREAGITTILITHHMDEVVDADMLVLMDQGKIVAQGTPQEIFLRPELLKTVKMDIPQVTELAERLKVAGLPVRTPVLHEKDLVEALTPILFSHGEVSPGECPEPCFDHDQVIMRISHLAYGYNKKTVNECMVLDDVSFDIHKGECIGLIGASGSGKTTLIKHLNGLLKADSGTIEYKEKNIYDKKYRMTDLRKEVGLVFQYPENQLFGRTVIEDVCYGPINMGLDKKRAQEEAERCLELVGIDKQYFYSSPHELSGGEKRRVAIAGVLAMNPQIIVLDEPSAGLDPASKYALFDLLKGIQDKLQIAIILVSHQMEDVARYADRVVVLENGHICAKGTPKQVFEKADHLQEIGVGVPQVARLTGQLIKNGVGLPGPSLTVDEAEKNILTLYSKIRGGDGQ